MPELSQILVFVLQVIATILLMMAAIIGVGLYVAQRRDSEEGEKQVGLLQVLWPRHSDAGHQGNLRNLAVIMCILIIVSLLLYALGSNPQWF